MAPLHVKLQVLDTCVASALLYACETWAGYGKEVEVIYRSGLRTALGIRTSINNEIVYVEADRFPLKCKIKKQKLKFWIHVKDYTNKNPNSALDIFVIKAIEINLPFIKYYLDLERENTSPGSCLVNLEPEFKDKWRSSCEAAHNDDDVV